MSSWILVVIMAIVISLFRGRKNIRFPKLPDGRNDTPLGPGGQRKWPPSRPNHQEPADGGRQGRSMTLGKSSEVIPGKEMAGPQRSIEKLDPQSYRTTEGWGTEGAEQLEGRSDYETKGTVHSTLEEPHETVRVTLREPHETVKESTVVQTAPRYENDKRKQPSAETERVFTGQSSYDRMGTDPVGRLSAQRIPFSIEKQDLMRAVVMSEILGPPRARNPRRLFGRPKRK